MSDPTLSESADDQIPKLPKGILNGIDPSVREPIPWVIEKLLAEGDQFIIFGAPKVGKSQIALQLAMAVALGKPFLGWEVMEPKRVLYLNFEMGNRSFMLRVAKHYLYAMHPPDSWKEKFPDPEQSDELRWLNGDEHTPPDENLLEEINQGIAERLFFTDKLRELESNIGPSQTAKNQKASNEEAQKARENEVIRYWRGIVDIVRPDLIIFDTLSKVHSVDECNNNEIKRVMLNLRKIATVATAADGARGTPENECNVDGRKELAHVIIHHARKKPSEGTGRLTVDNMRGGSAIRAEADLIFGLYERGSKGNHAKRINRTITIESRNFASSDVTASFNGWILDAAADVISEEEIENNEKELIELIRQVFVDSRMRGLGKQYLVQELLASLASLDKRMSKKQIENAVERIAKNPQSDIQILIKKGNEQLLAKFPYHRVQGNFVFWISDNSPWLDEPELAQSFSDHEPTPIRKRPDGRGSLPEKSPATV